MLLESLNFLYLLHKPVKDLEKYKNDDDLETLWRELDLYRPPTPNSLDREYILTSRVFFFLCGMNWEFDVYWTQIFNKKKKPNLVNFIA